MDAEQDSRAGGRLILRCVEPIGNSLRWRFDWIGQHDPVPLARTSRCGRTLVDLQHLGSRNALLMGGVVHALIERIGEELARVRAARRWAA